MSSDQTDREAGGRSRILFFRSGGERFAVDVLDLEEVVVGMEWTPVPLAPQGVAGVINHRGRIFTILDFAALCGLDGSAGAGGDAVLMHHPDMSVGLNVSSVEGIWQVPLSLLEDLEQPAEEGAEGWMRGVLDFEGRLATVLDAGKLTEAIAHMTERPQPGSGGD